jgi:hypothetical protein
MVNYCRCHGCRWSHCHLTEYHLCGKCQQFGHGQQECGNQQAIANLAPGVGDPNQLPQSEQCTVVNCNYTHSHTSASHTDGYVPGMVIPPVVLAPVPAQNPVPLNVSSMFVPPVVSGLQQFSKPAPAPAPVKSKLQAKQLEWLKDNLHPDCYYHIDANSFLTDTVYHIVKGLVHAKKEYPHESIYTFCSYSHNVMYGILEHEHQLAKVNIFRFDDNNNIIDFIHGYRMVSIDY